MGDTEGKDLLRTTSSHVRSAEFRPDERIYTQSYLDARIAAAQQETLKLASEHYRRFDSANLQSFCTCGWKEPNNEKSGIENWRDHIQGLLPAAQKASEGRDAKVFHDTLDDLADSPNLIVGGKVPVRVFSEKGLKERDALLVAGATKAACEIIHRLPYEEYLDNRKLEIQIENITPASALAALAEFARKERLAMRDACFADMLRLVKNCAADPPTEDGKEAVRILACAIAEQGPEGFGLALSPAEPQKEEK